MTALLSFTGMRLWRQITTSNYPSVEKNLWNSRFGYPHLISCVTTHNQFAVEFLYISQNRMHQAIGRREDDPKEEFCSLYSASATSNCFEEIRYMWHILETTPPPTVISARSRFTMEDIKASTVTLDWWWLKLVREGWKKVLYLQKHWAAINWLVIILGSVSQLDRWICLFNRYICHLSCTICCRANNTCSALWFLL